MTVPTRRQSVALLLSLDPPEWHLRHVRAVAEVAAWLALRAELAGCRLDRRLTETAAFLHDLDKLKAVKAELDGRRHGEGAARWLAEKGHPELGEAISGHPVTRLADATWFDEWFVGASPEALIVSYADKRAGQRLETMDERFESWERRYPPEERARRTRGNWSRETIAEVRERTRRLEDRVCAMAGVRPAQVRRLAWTGREMLRLREEARRAAENARQEIGR